MVEMSFFLIICITAKYSRSLQLHCSLNHLFFSSKSHRSPWYQLEHSNKHYPQGGKDRKDLQFSSVCMTRVSLFPEQKISHHLLPVKPCLPFSTCFEPLRTVNLYSYEKKILGFQLWYIIFYPKPLTLWHLLQFIHYWRLL